MSLIKISILSFILSSTNLMGYTHEIKETETYDGDNFNVVPKPPMGPLLDECSGRVEHKACEPKPIVKKKVKSKPKPVSKNNDKMVANEVVKSCPECKPFIKEMKIIEEREIPTYMAHEIALLAGYGNNGLDSETIDGEGYAETVTRFYGPVFGLRYTYRFSNEWSGSLEGLTNKTGLLGVGYSFGERR